MFYVFLIGTIMCLCYLLLDGLMVILIYMYILICIHDGLLYSVSVIEFVTVSR